MVYERASCCLSIPCPVAYPVTLLVAVLVVVLLAVLVTVLPVPSLVSKVIEYLGFQQAARLA